MEKATASWFVEMTTKFNQLAQNLGIEGPPAQEMRNFMIEIAKEQYKAGNKSGIAFALSDKGRQYFAAKA